MRRPPFRSTLLPAAEQAIRYLEGLPKRAVKARATASDVLGAIQRPLPDAPGDPSAIVADLVERADPGLTAMPSGRFFGWVIGGGLPSAIAADWLTSAWDQNAGSTEGTPSAAAFEQVALGWVIDLLRLPAGSSGAIVTGAQMANTVGLAAARNALFSAVGWDVEARGLAGAPPLHVVVGEERHDTITRALRLLGLGSDTARAVGADENGRMIPGELESMIGSLEGPAIVCAQVGNVNTGGVDRVGEIASAVERRRAKGHPTWLHVDGAFGLWARASRTLAPIVEGVERADSWATDGHKWPNVPYDCGVAIVAHPEPHRRAMSIHASYLPDSTDDRLRNPFDWTPELSRRARGFALYAALLELGKSGVESLIDRSVSYARRFRDRLIAEPGIRLLAAVELNQVLVRFTPATGDADEHTRRVVRAVQDDGTCYLTGTTWRGLAAMRISVSNATTDEEDVDRSVDAILRAHRV